MLADHALDMRTYVASHLHQRAYHQKAKLHSIKGFLKKQSIALLTAGINQGHETQKTFPKLKFGYFQRFE
jgi:hypothetical protein